jgi:hypothetical protein
MATFLNDLTVDIEDDKEVPAFDIWYLNEESCLRFNKIEDDDDMNYEMNPIFSMTGLRQLATILLTSSSHDSMMTFYEDYGYGDCQTTFKVVADECLFQGQTKTVQLFSITEETSENSIATRILHVLIVETTPVLIYKAYDDILPPKVLFVNEALPTFPGRKLSDVAYRMKLLLDIAKN